jgi:SGNH domain (fused to AT3 domains)
LDARGWRVALLEQFPEFEAFRASGLARSLRSGKADLEQAVRELAVIDRDRVVQRQSAMLALQRRLAQDGRVTVLGTHDRFCDATRCRLMYEGVPGYFDNNHITTATAMRLRGMSDAVFDPPPRAAAADKAIGRAP